MCSRRGQGAICSTRLGDRAGFQAAGGSLSLLILQSHSGNPALHQTLSHQAQDYARSGVDTQRKKIPGGAVLPVPLGPFITWLILTVCGSSIMLCFGHQLRGSLPPAGGRSLLPPQRLGNDVGRSQAAGSLSETGLEPRWMLTPDGPGSGPLTAGGLSGTSKPRSTAGKGSS
ncbi:hypothetical protein AAFF_G00240260 [Aldrovandia affinis]|uniref:Uncharacterized protein n=1 Tax=Aldrovandia affinis TaxID=143900 RepID=A0AAD7WU20_9TELE|nr:hypothetical protein AAFF_G00240260 [Aldrovandia affinis]